MGLRRVLVWPRRRTMAAAPASPWLSTWCTTYGTVTTSAPSVTYVWPPQAIQRARLRRAGPLFVRGFAIGFAVGLGVAVGLGLALTVAGFFR
jgi:hypothetical protein